MGFPPLHGLGRCGLFVASSLQKNPVELVSWEAIFEVVAPSDVEDPRRPCGRHGHGALCHLGLKNRFCTWKMVDFRSRWFQALGGSVVYDYLLPVIPDFRSSFFWGCDDGSLVAFDLVFCPSKDESKATGDSMCPIDIASSQFLDDTKAHWQWWFRRSCRVSDVRVSNITSAIQWYIIFSKTSKAFFHDGTTETQNPPSFAERGLIWSNKTWLESLVPSASFWDTAVLDIFVKRKDPKCSWSHRSKICYPG